MGLRNAFKVGAVVGVALLAFGCQKGYGPNQIDPKLEAKAYGTWGFDTAGMDTSTPAGKDFFRYSVGKAYDTLEIPGDRSSWGAFEELTELSNARSRDLIERAAASKGARGEAKKIGDLYNSFMDEKRVEALDAKPLANDLNAIKAADTKEKLAALMGQAPYTYYGSFFGIYFNDDAKNPDKYALYLGQSGLGLPNREYYLSDKFADKRAAYRTYVATMLRLGGWPEPDKAADAILKLETDVATVSWPLADSQDSTKTYNPMSPEELAAAAPGFPWATFLSSAKVGDVKRLIVGENTAFPKIAAVFANADLPTLQAWQAFTTIDSAAPVLSKRFVDARWDFRLKTLRGTTEQQPRWKRGVGVVESAMGEAVGKLYVEKYFPPAYKAEMQKLVANLKAAMQQRIEKNDWMSPATKQEALAKLAAMKVKIGYPDKWRDYSSLTIDPQDLYGNVKRGVAFEWQRQVNRKDEPVDKGEWYMTPQTVNAYNDPIKVETAYPAAFLQAPSYDPKADLAVNYGGIGATIGHEITHSFDDDGRHYDSHGVLRDWWTPEDGARFEARAKVIEDQFDKFEPFPGLHVNGKLTEGENIADLGGLIIAYEAYHAALGGKPAPVIDGLTGDQRFFLSYAQSWLSKNRDDAVKQQIVSNEHAPEIYRVNGIVPNMVEWQRAFGIKPGDPMYIPPEQMVRIW